MRNYRDSKCIVSAIALTAAIGALPMPAAAQSQAEDQDSASESSVDERSADDAIVVVGTRLVNEKFIDRRREAFTIVDSVGENEIASLPAYTAADVLRTIPGVSVSSEAIVTEGGGPVAPTTLEGRFVSVRGIRPDLNVVLLDGLNLAIPNELGRANFLDWFPVSLASRVEVEKTFTAEHDGNAIGGLINVVTRSGLDYSEPLLTLNAAVTHDEHRVGPENYSHPINFSGVYAAPISERLGIAATANYYRTDYFIPARSNTARVYFNEDGTRGFCCNFAFNNVIDADGNRNNPGNGLPVPMINLATLSNTQTERYGGAARLDFEPDEKSLIWLTGAVSILDQNVYGSASDARQPFFCFGFFGCVNNVAEQTPTSGLITVNSPATLTSQTGRSHNKSQLYSIQSGLKLEIDPNVLLKLSGGWSRAIQNQFDQFINFEQPATEFQFRYDLTDPLNPIFDYQNPDDIFDPSRYELTIVDQLPLTLREDVWDVRGDLTWNANETDEGLGIKTGLRFKRNDRKFTEEYIRRTAIGSILALSDVLSSSSNSSDLGIPYTGNFVPLLADRVLTESFVEPLLDDPSSFLRAQLSDLSNDYTLTEETFAGYLLGRYHAEDWEFVAGLRYEHTSNQGTGYRSSPNGTIFDDTGIAFERAANSGKRGYWLPSAALNYDLASDVRIRLAYSKTLGRPAYVHLAPRGEILTLPADPNSGEASLSLANPDIRARQSHNFDAAVEWYFAKQALVAASFFYKDIKDEIFLNGTKTELTFDGVTYITNVSQVQNAASAEIKGVELMLLTPLSILDVPFLENFGININAVFNDGRQDLNLFDFNGVTTGRTQVDFMPGQPEEVYNASLYYSDEKFDINLTLNHVGPYVVYINPQEAGQDTYSLASTRLDLAATYRFNDHANVFFKANNLTSEDLIQVSTSAKTIDASSLRDRYVGGRSFTFGVSYKF